LWVPRHCRGGPCGRPKAEPKTGGNKPGTHKGCPYVPPRLPAAFRKPAHHWDAPGARFPRRARSSFDFKVEKVLQVEPELRIRIKVARQPQGGVRRNATVLVYNLADAGCRHVEVERQLVDGQAEGFIKSSRRISPG